MEGKTIALMMMLVFLAVTVFRPSEAMAALGGFTGQHPNGARKRTVAQEKVSFVFVMA